MDRRPARTFLLALSFLVSIAALCLSAESIKAWIDHAAGGSSWFFGLPTVRELRVAALLLGPVVLLLPALRRLVATELPPSESTHKPRRALELLLLLAFVVMGLGRIENDPPLQRDAPSYLSTSIDIAETGGLVELPARLFSGEFTEANRHPLYAGLLSTVAERSDRFTDRARIFSLIGAALALLLAMRFACTHWGPHGALFAGALFLTNGVILQTSVSVSCETWLMVFALLWFDAATRAVSTKNSLFTGAFVGLAYLTKGTATLFFLSTCLQLLWSRGKRALFPIAFVTAGLIAVALPLLWRNTKLFSNPFHNVNSSQALWLDSWKDFTNPLIMQSAGPLHYLSTHSVGEIGQRLAVGIFKESIHTLEIFSIGWPESGVGLPILLAALLCLLRDKERPRKRLLLLLFSSFFLAFAWYAQIVQGWRFVGSLAPLLLLPAAALGPRLAARFGARRLEFASLALALALLILGFSRGAANFRLDRFAPTDHTETIHAFLERRVGTRSDVHYLLGPSTSLTSDWDIRIRGHRHPFPRTDREFAELMASNNGRFLRYAILVKPNPDDPRVDAQWVREDAGGLQVAAPPPGWELIRSIPTERPEILIFARTRKH